MLLRGYCDGFSFGIHVGGYYIHYGRATIFNLMCGNNFFIMGVVTHSQFYNRVYTPPM